jgi:ribose 5-phosphate isomerase B
MKIAFGSDHAGFALKEELLDFLKDSGHVLIDLGTFSTAPVDYPDFAAAVGRAVQTGEADRGIIVCGSGVGACIAANKLHGVRGGICHDTYSAHQGVEHDDMNVLCLGARIIGIELAREIVRTFLAAVFTAEERHVRRLSKVIRLDETGGL